MGGILFAAINAAIQDILRDCIKQWIKKVWFSLQQTQTADDNTIIGGNLDVTI